MTNKNKKSSTIENNDIFIYFSIALVTVVLMLIAPMLNKGIYAKTSTLPTNFEDKGKAQQTALTEESGKALETYMKPYEDSVNMTKSYQEENKRFLHNQEIKPAEQEKLQIDEYKGPRINEHKNFLPEGYFWDEGAKKMKELLAPNESDGKIDTEKTKNINFASELLNPYAGILCFYEGKRLPSGSQLSAEMYKAGLDNSVTGSYLRESIFKDNEIMGKLEGKVNENEGGFDGTYTSKTFPVKTTVTHPDFALRGGLTEYFGNDGQAYKPIIKGKTGGEGLKVGTQRGLGIPSDINPNVIQADSRTVQNAIKTKEEDDKNTLNTVFTGTANQELYIPRDWTSIFPSNSEYFSQEINKKGGRTLYTNKRINKKGGLKYETDDEHDGNYEDITGGHKLSVERNIIGIDGAFGGLMSQLRTRYWGDGEEYIKDVIQDTKKPGQKGVDSIQDAVWQVDDVDHVQHPNANTSPEDNKKKAAKRTAINPVEAKKLRDFVKKYQTYEFKFNEWIKNNNTPRELSWDTDGKQAKVVNHPKEPQIRYILPVGFHQDKEITTKEGEKVKAPNPKYQYQPKIESADPNGKSLKEVSKVKFDTKTQKWLIGPYKLKYFTHQMTEEDATNYNFDDPTLPRPKTFKVGKRDNDNLMADITEVQLYGVYENDVQNPQKENPNKEKEKDSIDPNRFGMKASDDSKYKFIKSWSFLTEHGELEPTKYPKSEEAFYFAVKYDPALHKIAKARFVFGYMVQGVKYSKITGTYNVVYAKDAQQRKNKSDKNGNKTTASINGKIVKGKDKRLYLYGKDINGNDYLVGELPSGTNIDGKTPIKIENMNISADVADKLRKSGAKFPDDVNKSIDDLLKSDSKGENLKKVLDPEKYKKVVNSLSNFKDWGKLDKNLLGNLGIDLGSLGNLGGLSGITGNIPLPNISGSIPGLGGSQGGFNLGRIWW